MHNLALAEVTQLLTEESIELARVPAINMYQILKVCVF